MILLLTLKLPHCASLQVFLFIICAAFELRQKVVVFREVVPLVVVCLLQMHLNHPNFPTPRNSNNPEMMESTRSGNHPDTYSHFNFPFLPDPLPAKSCCFPWSVLISYHHYQEQELLPETHFWKDQRSKVSDKLSPQFHWGDAASSGWDQTLGVTPQGAAEGSGGGIRDEWEYWLEPLMRLQRSGWPVERWFSEDSKQQESKMCWLAARSDWS